MLPPLQGPSSSSSRSGNHLASASAIADKERRSSHNNAVANIKHNGSFTQVTNTSSLPRISSASRKNDPPLTHQPPLPSISPTSSASAATIHQHASPSTTYTFNATAPQHSQSPLSASRSTPSSKSKRSHDHSQTSTCHVLDQTHSLGLRLIDARMEKAPMHCDENGNNDPGVVGGSTQLPTAHVWSQIRGDDLNHFLADPCLTEAETVLCQQSQPGRRSSRPPKVGRDIASKIAAVSSAGELARLLPYHFVEMGLTELGTEAIVLMLHFENHPPPGTSASNTDEFDHRVPIRNPTRRPAGELVWSVRMPDDSEVDVEHWSSIGLPGSGSGKTKQSVKASLGVDGAFSSGNGGGIASSSPAARYHSSIQSRGLFQLRPTSGRLRVGGNQALEIIYYPLFPGEHVFPLVMSIRDANEGWGRTFSLVLRARTVQVIPARLSMEHLKEIRSVEEKNELEKEANENVQEEQVEQSNNKDHEESKEASTSTSVSTITIEEEDPFLPSRYPRIYKHQFHPIPIGLRIGSTSGSASGSGSGSGTTAGGGEGENEIPIQTFQLFNTSTWQPLYVAVDTSDIQRLNMNNYGCDIFRFIDDETEEKDPTATKKIHVVPPRQSLNLACMFRPLETRRYRAKLKFEVWTTNEHDDHDDVNENRNEEQQSSALSRRKQQEVHVQEMWIEGEGIWPKDAAIQTLKLMPPPPPPPPPPPAPSASNPEQQSPSTTTALLPLSPSSSLSSSAVVAAVESGPPSSQSLLVPGQLISASLERVNVGSIIQEASTSRIVILRNLCEDQPVLFSVSLPTSRNNGEWTRRSEGLKSEQRIQRLLLGSHATDDEEDDIQGAAGESTPGSSSSFDSLHISCTPRYGMLEAGGCQLLRVDIHSGHQCSIFEREIRIDVCLASSASSGAGDAVQHENGDGSGYGTATIGSFSSSSPLNTKNASTKGNKVRNQNGAAADYFGVTRSPLRKARVPICSSVPHPHRQRELEEEHYAFNQESHLPIEHRRLIQSKFGVGANSGSGSGSGSGSDTTTSLLGRDIRIDYPAKRMVPLGAMSLAQRAEEVFQNSLFLRGQQQQDEGNNMGGSSSSSLLESKSNTSSATATTKSFQPSLPSTLAHLLPTLEALHSVPSRATWFTTGSSIGGGGGSGSGSNASGPIHSLSRRVSHALYLRIEGRVVKEEVMRKEEAFVREWMQEQEAAQHQHQAQGESQHDAASDPQQQQKKDVDSSMIPVSHRFFLPDPDLQGTSTSAGVNVVGAAPYSAPSAGGTHTRWRSITSSFGGTSPNQMKGSIEHVLHEMLRQGLQSSEVNTSFSRLHPEPIPYFTDLLDSSSSSASSTSSAPSFVPPPADAAAAIATAASTASSSSFSSLASSTSHFHVFSSLLLRDTLSKVIDEALHREESGFDLDATPKVFVKIMKRKPAASTTTAAAPSTASTDSEEEKTQSTQ